MAASKTLIQQSSAPTSITPSTVVLYVDSSNQLLTITSGGAPVAPGTLITGRIAQSAIRTGTAAYLATGTVFGTAQGAILQTGLGTPAGWAPITVNGTGYAIPFYALA